MFCESFHLSYSSIVKFFSVCWARLRLAILWMISLLRKGPIPAMYNNGICNWKVTMTLVFVFYLNDCKHLHCMVDTQKHNKYIMLGLKTYTLVNNVLMHFECTAFIFTMYNMQHCYNWTEFHLLNKTWTKSCNLRYYLCIEIFFESIVKLSNVQTIKFLWHLIMVFHWKCALYAILFPMVLILCFTLLPF